MQWSDWSSDVCLPISGEGVGDHAGVPAVVFAEPESDRTPVEIHQTAGALWSLPSQVRRVPSRNQGDHRWPFDDSREAIGNADDAQLSAI